MRLTQRQDNMIAAFLRQMAGETDGLPARERAQLLARVKRDIRHELEALGDVLPRDEQVAAALRKCRAAFLEMKNRPHTAGAGTVQAPAPELRAPYTPPPTAPSETPEETQRRWLGVCLALDERLGIPAAALRAAFFTLGLITGPVALILYLGAYLELRLISRANDVPPFDPLRVAGASATALAWIVALYAFSRGLMWAAAEGFERLVGKPLVLGEWAWLDAHEGTLLFWVLFISLPLALLSALPVANDWDKTLKKLYQAAIALYAVGLSFGIASAVVGIILRLVEEFAP